MMNFQTASNVTPSTKKDQKRMIGLIGPLQAVHAGQLPPEKLSSPSTILNSAPNTGFLFNISGWWFGT